MQSGNSDRIDVLDGLRGLAILLVVIFHVWQLSWWDFSKLTGGKVDLWWAPQAGFLGVELFFVISGFCIAYPFASGKTLTWREFYRRRALKVLPSYLLALIVCAVFFDDGTVRAKPVLHLLTHLTFTHNWFFETYYSTLGPAWSLAVEVQFYLLFPLLYLPLKRWPYLTTLAMALLAVYWRRWAWDVSGEDAGPYTERLNQLPGCLDLFACGIAAAYLTPWLREKLTPPAAETATPSASEGVAESRSPSPLLRLSRENGSEERTPKRAPETTLWAKAIASALAIAAAAGLFLLYRSFLPATSGDNWVKCATPLWQAKWRLPIGLLALTLIVGGGLSFRPVQWALASPPLRFLALISYSLYLWHKPLADYLYKRPFPSTSAPSPHDDLAWQGPYTGAAIGLAILVATALTFAVERPFLSWGRRRKTSGTITP